MDPKPLQAFFGVTTKECQKRGRGAAFFGVLSHPAMPNVLPRGV